MKPCLKRQTTHTQTAPTVAHLWGADLRERRRIKVELAAKKKWAEDEQYRHNRYRAYLELCNAIIHCRTSKGKVGFAYPILKAKLRDWVANYPTTTREWTGITMCIMRHNIQHLAYFPSADDSPVMF